MPFYEYQCSACNHHTEVLRKISDAPLRKCPNCGKQALKRLISAPVFRLKGGGWYETDFKSDGEKKRNLAGGEEAGPSKSDDAKPAVAAKDAVKTETKAADAAPAAAKPEKASKSASKSEAKQVKGKAPVKKKAAKR